MTAEQIAVGLTAGERQALNELLAVHHPSWAVFNLIYQGLATYRPRWFLFGEKVVRLTRKGRKVRAILERQSK